jgi:UDP-glucuronate decarboxylase
MLHLAKETGARIIQASTSEVYGDPSISPQPETYWGNVNPIGIRSCYDEGKRAAETLCFDYKRQYGVDSRLVRIFNTYGPNMAVGDGRVVSNFIVQALQGDPITIYGDGSQTRSFCFVSDLIEGIYKMLMLEGPVDTPINLGNPGEFSMLELAEKVIRITKSNSRIIFEPLPQDDPRQRKPDISLANTILGWQPKIVLETGIDLGLGLAGGKGQTPRQREPQHRLQHGRLAESSAGTSLPVTREDPAVDGLRFADRIAGWRDRGPGRQRFRPGREDR